MDAAGRAAAGVIARRCADRLGAGVAVFAGPGNNGGDAWVVARELARIGVTVRVTEIGAARSDDARRARDEALPRVSLGGDTGGEGLVVDGLLGTGARGEPAGAIAGAVHRIRDLRAAGAAVVALDLPTGLDATTGAAAAACVDADLTVTFGTIKRGHLVARGRCGDIVVVDIGLGEFAELADGAPPLVDEAWVSARVPRVAAEGHKGDRRRVGIVGGARGMAGATVLAARAAARSGAGMVRLVVAGDSLAAVQSAAVEATATSWPLRDDMLRAMLVDYAHAILLGPGLGTSDEARALVRQILEQWHGPVVVDADGLNLFAADVPGFAAALGRRPALITPHVAELARLVGAAADGVNARRFEIGGELARELGAVVLLKGVPTVISAPDGTVVVCAAGTPVLATAGSGDVLGGIAVTLLAQTGDPLASATCAAWVHGRAGEIANAGRPTRGVVLDDVLSAIAHAWRFSSEAPEPPELLALPRVGDPP